MAESFQDRPVLSKEDIHRFRYLGLNGIFNRSWTMHELGDRTLTLVDTQEFGSGNGSSGCFCVVIMALILSTTMSQLCP